MFLGSITYGDLQTVAPFPNTVDIVKISGETMKNMFEFAVAEYDPAALDPFGGFLQVSGTLLHSITLDLHMNNIKPVLYFYFFKIQIKVFKLFTTYLNPKVNELLNYWLVATIVACQLTILSKQMYKLMLSFIFNIC